MLRVMLRLLVGSVLVAALVAWPAVQLAPGLEELLQGDRTGLDAWWDAAPWLVVAFYVPFWLLCAGLLWADIRRLWSRRS